MPRLHCFNPSCFFGLSADSPYVFTPLTLPARYLRPVIRISSIREVLILFKFILYGCQYILSLNTAVAFGNHAFYGMFLTSCNNAFNHRTACKIFKIEDLFFSIGISNFEEPVFLIKTVHAVNRNIYQSLNDLLSISIILFYLGFMKGKIRGMIFGKYIYFCMTDSTNYPYFYL